MKSPGYTLLLREKQTADGDRQKVLRAQMRRLGFYITDYADYAGFTASDLDNLIQRGTITVTAVEESERAEVARPGQAGESLHAIESGLTTWPEPATTRELSADAAEAIEGREQLKAILLDSAEEGDARWLAAQLLDYHRREARLVSRSPGYSRPPAPTGARLRAGRPAPARLRWSTVRQRFRADDSGSGGSRHSTKNAR